MKTARNWKAGLVATGAAVGLTLAGLGVAGAQTEEAPEPPANEAPDAAMKRGPGGHKGRGMGALHGEFTTKAPAGGYQTIATQVGEVTEVGATSIVVKSEDGFSRAYSVDDGTMVNAGNNGIADVKVGDKVHVKAVVADGKARAVAVHDTTQAKELRSRWAPPRGAKGTN